MIERAASGKSSGQRLARQLYYWGAVALIFSWAAWQRFALPLDPIADPDVWGYLAPALRKLVGAEFGHTYGRNVVYPGFVYSLLRAFGDFRAIVITQRCKCFFTIAAQCFALWLIWETVLDMRAARRSRLSTSV